LPNILKYDDVIEESVNMELKFHKKPELKRPRMLVGLPGMGMVAKTTVSYFMDFLKPEFFAEISVPYLSPSVACFDKGLVIPMDRKISPFKFYYSRENDIIMFSGEMQFGHSAKDNELADKITDAAKLCGVETIYTVIATQIKGYVEEPEVSGLATSPELLNHLESEGIKIANGKLQISGVNGLVIEYAMRKGIEGIALLSQTAFPEAMDIKACYAGIKKVSELIGIDIDLGKIETEVKKFDENVKKHIKEIKDKRKKEEDLSYIG
jgi:proteasome assembly chaperone (PAC2) family protein